MGTDKRRCFAGSVQLMRPHFLIKIDAASESQKHYRGKLLYSAVDDSQDTWTKTEKKMKKMKKMKRKE